MRLLKASFELLNCIILMRVSSLLLQGSPGGCQSWWQVHLSIELSQGYRKLKL